MQGHLPKRCLALSISSIGPSQPAPVNSGFFIPKFPTSRKAWLPLWISSCSNTRPCCDWIGTRIGCKIRLQRFVVFFAGAGTAQDSSVAQNFAAEIDAFATLGTDDALTLESREFFRRKVDFHPLFRE